MRFVRYRASGEGEGIAVHASGGYLGLDVTDARFPGTLGELVTGPVDALARAAEVLLAHGRPLTPDTTSFLPPVGAPGKILCIGLNYRDHAAETELPVPEFPNVFARFRSSLVGHGAPILRPPESTELDFEGELVVVIGTGGRRIRRQDALTHVAGYSAFNDASIRDFQLRTSQWTVGKNFDATGAFGPALVTPDEVPEGCRGCRIETRVNGRVMQSASTDDMIFDVASLIEFTSRAMTLEPGDLIVTGTPAGVGFTRKPPLFLAAGDLCEIEIQNVGVLANPIADEGHPRAHNFPRTASGSDAACRL